MQQRACEGSWTSPVRFLCNIYITCNESERCANKITKHDGDTETLNTSTCVRFVKKEAPESYLLIIHFSERVRGCCPSCACLRLCRRAALQIHTIGPLRPGVLHSPNNQSAKKNIQPSAVKRRISLGSLRSPFLGLCFPLPPKNRNLRV